MSLQAPNASSNRAKVIDYQNKRRTAPGRSMMGEEGPLVDLFYATVGALHLWPARPSDIRKSIFHGVTPSARGGDTAQLESPFSGRESRQLHKKLAHQYLAYRPESFPQAAQSLDAHLLSVRIGLFARRPLTAEQREHAARVIKAVWRSADILKLDVRPPPVRRRGTAYASDSSGADYGSQAAVDAMTYATISAAACDTFTPCSF